MALFVYIALDYILTKKERYNQPEFEIDERGEKIEKDMSSSKKLTVFKTCVVILAGLFYSVVIGISRYLLDSNYIDQILYAWVLGIWLAIFFALVMRNPVHKHIRSLLDGE